MSNLLNEDLNVINLGVAAFGDAVIQAGGSAVTLDWRPPADGDAQCGQALAKLINHPKVEAANAEAFARYLSARPVLTGIGRAQDLIPAMADRLILHAGPPVEWLDMCGPMQGAIIGAIVFEGWADDLASAEKLAANGEITFAPCHHHGAVGPMCGVISPSMPVWIIENQEHGNKAFSNFNEGLGKVLRFGANSTDVLERLVWMRDILAPALAQALDIYGSLELKPLMAQALHMGDEVHNRNAAATSLFLKMLVPSLLKIDLPQDDIAAVIEFMAGNDHFFLNLSMAACKAMLDAAHNVEHSSMVTAMSRNGVTFGIRVSGLDDQWFTTPAPLVDGLYFSGYSMDDAAPDIGDSAITETAGIGGFAMAAAPAIVQFVGGGAADAIAKTREMGNITLGRNDALTLPALDFIGTPAGIDMRKVVDSGILPVINTGIAHKQAGIGQIGAGITNAPLACFTQAITALANKLDE